MGPRPSFQFRRGSAKLSHSRPSLAPSLPPVPLQPLTNRQNIPQPLSKKQPSHSKRLSIAEPLSKKKPRQKRSRNALYRRVKTGVPEELRLKELLDTVMLEEYNTKYANASSTEREQFEEAMLKVSDFLEKTVANAEDNHESVTSMRKPNPMNAEMERRVIQLEEILKNYKIELEKWGEVEAESAKPVEIPTLKDTPNEGELGECPDPEELAKSSAGAIEMYILQTDHLSNILRKLESRNRETHSRVQAIAAALNNRVMSEFGKKFDGGLTPPPNLANVKISTGDML